MATKDKPGSKPPEKPAHNPPPGYRPLTAESGAPWWKPDGATPLEGEVIGVFESKFGPYVQLKLLRDSAWNDKDGNSIMAKKGSTVNVSTKTARLRVLGKCEAGVSVYIISSGAKVDLPDGRTMWDVECYVAETDSDNVPF